MSKKYLYKILFIRKINSIYVVQYAKTYTKTIDVITISDKSYHVAYSNPAYLTKSRRYFSYYDTFVYVIDVDTASQLSYHETQALIDPKRLKIIVKSNVMQQMSRSLTEDTKKTNMTTLILCFLVGAVIGAMGMYIYFSSKISDGGTFP